MVSNAMNGNLKTGILAAVVFPAVMVLCLAVWVQKKSTKEGV
jgi:hypothetical protein